MDTLPLLLWQIVVPPASSQNVRASAAGAAITEAATTATPAIPASNSDDFP
ncbi:MAG: hypothetical protein K0U84_20815 [Actinomycetia bacterium]|nr:hypothetical protein [Actinomycetes bacterium]